MPKEKTKWMNPFIFWKFFKKDFEAASTYIKLLLIGKALTVPLLW